MGLSTLLAEAHVAGHRSAALAHAVQLRSSSRRSPARKAASATMSDAFSTPWPPRPAMTMLVTVIAAQGTSHICLIVRRGQQAVAPRDDHGEFRPRQALRHQLLERRAGSAQGSITCTLRMPIARARSSKTSLPVRVMVERAARAGMLLHARHRGGAVVEDDHHVPGGGGL